MILGNRMSFEPLECPRCAAEIYNQVGAVHCPMCYHDFDAPTDELGLDDPEADDGDAD